MALILFEALLVVIVSTVITRLVMGRRINRGSVNVPGGRSEITVDLGGLSESHPYNNPDHRSFPTASYARMRGDVCALEGDIGADAYKAYTIRHERKANMNMHMAHKPGFKWGRVLLVAVFCGLCLLAVPMVFLALGAG